MLLRHVLSLAGVVTAAPSSGSTNTHNFTADDIVAVASDVNNRVFRTYPTKSQSFLQGLVDDDDALYVSPTFWGAVLDHGRLSNETAFDITIFNAVDGQFDSSNGLFVWDTEKNIRKPRVDIENGDVASWGLLALSASELNFHPDGLRADWLKYAQDVFNYLSAQWNNPEYKRRGGISSLDVRERGDDEPYGSSFFAETNGKFFYIAAKLAHVTGQGKYKDWADKVYDWMDTTGMIASNFTVYADIPADPDYVPMDGPEPNWSLASADSAMVAAGAAHMHNLTQGDGKWKTRTEGIVGQIKKTFFPKDGILIEECETKTESYLRCRGGQAWEKAQTPPLLVSVIKDARFTADTLAPLLKSNAAAIAKTCVEDTNSPCKPNVAQAQVYALNGAGDDMGNYVAALTALNAVLAVDALPATKKGNDNDGAKDPKETKSDGSKPGSKDDKSTASSLSSVSSVWGLVLVIVAGIMSM